MAMTNEFFFFATISHVPVIFVLFKIVTKSIEHISILGSGIFAVVISVKLKKWSVAESAQVIIL
jgi:hypothetical protein